MTDFVSTNTPILATWRDLAQSMVPFHRWDKRYVDTLHDVWRRGCPTPTSIIRQPKGYDERRDQPGNHVTRIVPDVALARWIADVTQARGMPLDWRQCLNIANGRADYGLDLHTQPLLIMDMGKGTR